MKKILIGGSPCTKWSIAQKNNRETTAAGIGWELFKNYLIAKEKFQPDFFLYENNKSAAQPIKEQISIELGVQLEYINSALVSAQNRQRFYAHNILDVPQPVDRGILLRDILETTATEPDYLLPQIKSLSENEMDYMVRDSTGGYSDRWAFLQKPGESAKSLCIPANIHKGVPYNIVAEPIHVKVVASTKQGLVENYLTTHNTPIYEVRNGSIVVKGKQHPIKLKDGYYIIRKLTVTECCRLQTLPDDYCRAVSNSQAYKGLGNGWTAEVILHILKHMNIPLDEELVVLSMYDGIGTGRYCLDTLGYKNVTYYAYEIDKYAMQIALSNYPDIIQCGDAFSLRDPEWNL